MREKNEYLKQENYYEGYQKSIEDLKNRPDVMNIDKLAYLVYSTKDGKQLLEVYKDYYLFPSFSNPNSANFSDTCIYFEGFKEAFRQIIRSVKAHEQRIEAESLKNESI